MLFGKVDDSRPLAGDAEVFFHPVHVILPDLFRPRPVQPLVQKTEVYARLECSVHFTDSIGRQKQNPLLEVRLRHHEEPDPNGGNAARGGTQPDDTYTVVFESPEEHCFAACQLLFLLCVGDRGEPTGHNSVSLNVGFAPRA